MAKDPSGELLARAGRGDAAAFAALFDRHRPAIERAISWRLDRRLTARVDVSDIVQETALEASRRLPEFLAGSTMPFGLWLRWLARERLLQVHRQHLGAEKRAATREMPALPVESSVCIVRALAGRGPSPSAAAAAGELIERLRAALGRLDDDERDVILWRHFEQLTNREIAGMLRITEAAAGKRYVRAVERLRGFLMDLGISGPV